MHLSSSSVRGEVIETLLTLAANVAERGSRNVQLIAIHARTAGSGGGATQSGVVLAGDGLLKTAATHIDGALIGRVPVTGDRRVLGQGKIGLGLLNLFRLVGVLVDDRLKMG